MMGKRQKKEGRIVFDDPCTQMTLADARHRDHQRPAGGVAPAGSGRPCRRPGTARLLPIFLKAFAPVPKRQTNIRRNTVKRVFHIHQAIQQVEKHHEKRRRPPTALFRRFIWRARSDAAKPQRHALPASMMILKIRRFPDNRKHIRHPLQVV